MTLSKRQFLTGLILGIFFAFSLYAFLFSIRELIRIFSLNENYDLWILSDKEVHFFNLFIAYFSVILGQSVAFNYWFNKPRQSFEHDNRKKANIFVDQWFLNWNFFYWFFQIVVLTGVFFINAAHFSHVKLAIYPKYNYVFYLIIIVLFLQTWTKIRFYCKRKSREWMLYSFLILSIIALGFSKINIIDYKKLNQSLLKKNIAYQYNLKLPKSKNYRNLGRRDLQRKIYIVKSKTGKTLAFFEFKKVPIKNISKSISDWRSKRKAYIRPYLNTVLLIDKSTKMIYVDSVMNQLQKINLDGISFGVSATNEENHFPYKEFSIRINELKTDDSLTKFSNVITVNLLKNNNYLVNNHEVIKSELSNLFKTLISENTDYIVRVHTDKNTDFGTYYSILSSLHNSIQELRKDYAKKRFKQNYEWLDRNKTKIVRSKYPFHFKTF